MRTAREVPTPLLCRNSMISRMIFCSAQPPTMRSARFGPIPSPRAVGRQRTKHEAMAQLSAVGVPAGAVLDTQELIDEPSFRQRGILQTMTHGERKMTMPTWPVRFDGVPSEVKSAPLLGEHTADVLADWLGLDAAAVASLREDGIV